MHRYEILVVRRGKFPKLFYSNDMMEAQKIALNEWINRIDETILSVTVFNLEAEDYVIELENM